MKKALSLLLALMLVFGMLSMVACGGDSGDDKKENTSSNKNDKDDKDDKGDKEDGANKGETIESESGDMPAVTVTSKKVKMFLTGNLQDRYKTMLKDEYGLEVDAESGGYNDYTTKFATLVLSGESPDVGSYRPDSADFPRYIVNNLVDDVNQYVDLSHKFYDRVRDMIDATTYQGGNYMMPYTLEQSQTMFYNKKLFEDYGMETPWELYLKDEWTLDKLQEYAIEMTEMGADGVPTRYGLGMCRAFGMLYTVGIPMGEFDAETGAVIVNNTDPAIARSMRYLSEWVNNYKCTPNQLEDTINWLADGRIAMVFAQNFYTNAAVVSLAKDGNLGIVPMARDSQTDGYYARGEVLSFWLVKGAKNPGGAVALWNAYILDAEKQGHLEQLFKTAEENGFSEENMEQMKNNYNPEKVKLVMELCPWLGGPAWTVIQNNSTWEVELEKASASQKAQIDSLFKPLENDLPLSPKPIDTFNDYDGLEDGAAITPYVTGGGTISVTLDKANAQGGAGFAAKFAYNVGEVGYCTVSYNVGKTWENNNAIRFWAKGDGTDQTVRISISCVTGAQFFYELKLSGDEGKLISIPFEDFTVAETSFSEEWELSKIQKIDFMVNNQGGDHVFYLDNLEAFDTNA